ncbi:InlB B-repeat-containing protein, partial [Hominenteromicrobium sp.]|uniref:InlB B-repeat-containing protein n=1 Tax=Hominenteromicrobium sp. TaxID=3073581 RepID=UPI003A91EBA2
MLVKCKVVVESGATITGGRFHQMLNYGTVKNSLLSNNDIENCDGGTMTNCLFKCSNPPVGVANYHKLTVVNNSEFEVTLLNTPSRFKGWTTYYFTGTPKLVVRLSKYGGGFNELQCINGRIDYGDKTGPDSDGYYTFIPNAHEDVVLNLNYYITDLVITKDGFPDTTGREPIYGTGCRGNGWTYENGTLTLERGKYDFSKDGLGQLAPDVKLVVGAGAKLTGGAFNEIPHGLTADNVQPIILNGSGLNGSGSIEAVNGLSSQKWSKKLYAIKDSQVEIKASVPLADINCRVIDPHYYPDSRDKTTLLFTINGDFIFSYTKLGETELTLNKSTRTNLIMLDNGCPNLEGVPYNWDSMYTYTGDGWKYVFNNSGSLRLNDTSSYNFRYLDPLSKNGNKLAAVTCGIINSGATIEDGVFKNLVINHSGIISGGTFAVGLFSIDSEDFSTSGTVTGGAFNGKDGLSDGAHAVTVNGGSIRKVNDTEPLVLDSSHNLTTGTEWNLYSYEGTIVTVTADTEITNINGWDIGKFRGSSYPNGADDKKTVSFRMPDGPVVLNDTLYTLDIIRGTMMGNTSVSVPAGTELILDADEPAKNETFLGWTLSDKSLLTKGTLNDPNCKTITIKMNNASATAEAVFQKDTPAYTLTVTGGGLVNGKTSAVVEAGDEVRLTVGEMQEGMSFNYWDLPTALTKALTDSSSGGFSNKVEPLTF